MDKARTDTVRAGFTVVETMIVLAIAGVFLLVVFLAVPALERSSRNNQRRQDVSLMLEAVSHYELNDSGGFPKNCDASSACTTNVGGSTSNDNFLQFYKSKLTYYTDPSQVILVGQSSSGTTESNTADADHVYIYNYQKCDPSGSGQPITQGAGYNDVVALFAIETGGGSALQCQQL